LGRAGQNRRNLVPHVLVKAGFSGKVDVMFLFGCLFVFPPKPEMKGLALPTSALIYTFR